MAKKKKNVVIVNPVAANLNVNRPQVVSSKKSYKRARDSKVNLEKENNDK